MRFARLFPPFVLVGVALCACGSAEESSESDAPGGRPAPNTGPIDSTPRVPTATAEELMIPSSQDPNNPFSSEVFRRGMAAWRTPHPKGACASCHSMDASDLGFFSYTDAVILRRALGVGASVEDAHAVVDLVHFQRQRLGFQKLVDPTKYSPLQPGGEMLPGDTFIDRDRAFHAQLVAMGHPYATQTISDSATAISAMKTIADMDMRAIRVGFQFPRWTDDQFRGDAHHSLNDWVAEYPSHPKVGMVGDYYALHNAYIEDPSDAKLWEVVDRAPEMTDNLNLIPLNDSGNIPSSAVALGISRYRAVLLGAHMLRYRTMNRPAVGFDEVDPSARRAEYPLRDRITRFWDVGAPMGSGGHPTPSVMTWPQFVVEKDLALINGKREFGSLVRRPFARAWFWMGFMYDPPCQFTAAGNRTEYFPAHLKEDYLYMHDAFAASTMAAHLVFAKDTRFPGAGNGFRHRFDNGNAAAIFGGSMGGFGQSLDGFDRGSKKAYPADMFGHLRNFVVNDLRAQIFVFKASLEAGHPMNEKEGRIDKLDAYTEILRKHDAKFESIRADIAATRALAVNTKERDPKPTVTEAKAFVNRFDGQSNPTALMIPANAESEPSVSRFGKVYDAKCAGCHGDDAAGHAPGGEVAGHGSSFAGYPPLTNYAKGESAFVEIVRKGSHAVGMPVPMPWYTTKQISDAELLDMYRALQVAGQ